MKWKSHYALRMYGPTICGQYQCRVSTNVWSYVDCKKCLKASSVKQDRRKVK